MRVLQREVSDWGCDLYEQVRCIEARPKAWTTWVGYDGVSHFPVAERQKTSQLFTFWDLDSRMWTVFGCTRSIR